jgi:23S rRNA (cytidine1920-2'-O)/16S rRNA (cytidine1409-2'-O)-methyltransferase
MGKKTRLDQVLVERGLAPTRSRAQALILAGAVFSGEKRLDKPGMGLAPDAPLDIRGKSHPYVSRGGVKLAHALDRFSIDPAGAVALDIGASTGGFTDVLLRRGASRVYAVDVGHGQLDWNLRNDPRVALRERVNARKLTSKEIPEPVDFIVCDTSFIGLETVLPAALDLAKPRATLVALIKPQFEVGPKRVGKGGVVRDRDLHKEVCGRVVAWLESRGWRVLGLTESPLKGADGNAEFLVAARRA